MSQETATILHCANHPDRETLLRCNRCDKPICTQCAIRTPVGFRCPECVRGQQAMFYNANRYDLVIVGIVGFLLSSLLGALSFGLLGAFGWFSLLIAVVAGPAAGGGIAEVIRTSVRRRRARHMRWVAAAACVLGLLFGGALLILILTSVPIGRDPAAGLLWLMASLVRPGPLLLGGFAASTIYARLK